jgi:hypothetical protein
MCDQEPNESHLHGDNKRSPEDAANWLSLATFHWTARLLWVGKDNIEAGGMLEC